MILPVAQGGYSHLNLEVPFLSTGRKSHLGQTLLLLLQHLVDYDNQVGDLLQVVRMPNVGTMVAVKARMLPRHCCRQMRVVLFYHSDVILIN